MTFFKTLGAILLGFSPCVSAMGADSSPTKAVAAAQNELGVTLSENVSGRVRIDSLKANGIADNAGLWQGDIILSADGHAIVGLSEFAKRLSDRAAKVVLLKVDREGVPATVQLPLTH